MIHARSFFLGIVAVVVATAIAGAIVVQMGVYDVAADTPHVMITREFITYVRKRSIAARARNIAVPKLDDPKRIADGASDYDAMCTGCHLAPGMAENEMRPGLNPRPPRLDDFPAPPPAEAFWIIKHGIKLSAMPAWGKTHSDAEIWNMVAFLQTLPTLSPAQYQALVKRAAGHHESDGMKM